jgi:2-aminobenzoylacetyl-CoA thioesterase
MNNSSLPNFLGNNVYIIGPSYAPIYLYEYKENCWCLVDGGLTKNCFIALQQIELIVQDLSDIKIWLITHAHFDHFGCVEFLYSKFPNVNVYASAKSCALLESKKYRQSLRKLNLKVGDANQSLDELQKTIKINPVDIDCNISIENQQIYVMSLPGHSEDSVGYSFADKGVTFVGDALGDFCMGKIRPLIFQSCWHYLSSIKKLADRSSTTLLLGHHVVIDRNVYKRTLDDIYNQTRQFIACVKAELTESESLSTLAQCYSIMLYPTVSEIISSDVLEKSCIQMFALIDEYDLSQAPL